MSQQSPDMHPFEPVAATVTLERVLVTGANGFIGSNLCGHLADLPGIEVIGLVRPASDLTFLGDNRDLALVRADLADRERLSAAMRGVSTVYHVAGLASDWGAWDDFERTNIEGVRNILAAARASGVRRLVHVSSVSVYGFPGGIDLGETTPFVARPRDRYITTKAAGDRLAMQANGYGLETVVVRPGGVYGPNDRITTGPMARALMRGRFGYVDGGRHVLAPLYVGNLVELLRLAGEHPDAPGHAFNAVDDGRTIWRQFIESFCEDLDCHPPSLSLPAALAWPMAATVEAAARVFGARSSPPINTYRIRATMQDNHYSAAKAKRLLGWAPSVSTREGVRRAARWHLEAAR